MEWITPNSKENGMEILSETEENVVRMQCEFTETERQVLLDYSDKNMSQETREELLIEWAMIEILKEEVNSKLTEGDV